MRERKIELICKGQKFIKHRHEASGEGYINGDKDYPTFITIMETAHSDGMDIMNENYDYKVTIERIPKDNK